jgi:hypothetical protein
MVETDESVYPDSDKVGVVVGAVPGGPKEKRTLSEHVWLRPGMMAGPHWHPVLAETFAVEEATIRVALEAHRCPAFLPSPSSLPVPAAPRMVAWPPLSAADAPGAQEL